MNKEQEIEILTKAIAALGPDSYLGPWLSQIKGGVADLVKCDIFPDITLNDAIKSSDGIILKAKADAADLIIAAQSKAQNIENDANRHRDHIASAMRASLRSLERW